jgi:hypothetical protein
MTNRVDALASLRRPVDISQIGGEHELVKHQRGHDAEEDRAQPGAHSLRSSTPDESMIKSPKTT